MRTGVITLIEISFTSICFLIAMLVKNLVASITVSFIVMLILNGVEESLISKKWTEGFIKFTSVGQTFLIIADASNKNIIYAVIAFLIGIIITISISYMMFRKEELK